jgi:hypothetical protein
MSAPQHDDSLLHAAPGLARIAATAWLKTAGWTVSTTVGAGRRVVKAAVNGESPADFFQTAGSEARQTARRLLGIMEGAAPEDIDGATRRSATDLDPEASPEALRERGSELLRQSADVRFRENAHPAYARILCEVAPDEARILRFLALDGAQPAVDVRTGRPLNIGSQLIAPGLSMIGAQAGCRNLERVPAYLNNLYRLGLIWFSREPLEDPLRYQVLEAQPDVLAALRAAGHGRTVRRSIALTPFGEDFCSTCLPLHTAELDALPLDATDAEAQAARATEAVSPRSGPSARPGASRRGSRAAATRPARG